MLIARNLSFAYGPGRPVLQDVSITCEPGITAVIGPNAAGKSTLLRLLAGLLTPTAGAVALDDRAMSSLSPPDRARRLAYVAQRPTISAGFSVREVVALGRFALPADSTAIQAAMDRAEVASIADRSFAQLSVGQQQRVALARALAQLSPFQFSKILLADEPIAAMDPEHALATCELLRSLSREGLTIAVVLHDLTIAARLADRVIILDAHGRIAAHAPPAEALTPERLGSIFHVRFAESSTAGGRVLVADSRSGDTSRPATGV